MSQEPDNRLSNLELIGPPLAFCYSPTGLVLFAERHRILSYTPSTGFSIYSGDVNPGYVEGNRATARFNSIRGLCFSKDGDHLFVSDSGNHCIRKIDSKGNSSLYAGTLAPGLVNGSLLESSFSSPSGLCLGGNGDLWVADTNNHMIRCISDVQGLVSTLVGDGFEFGTLLGPLNSCSLRKPHIIRQDLHRRPIIISELDVHGSSCMSTITDAANLTQTVNSHPDIIDVLPCASSSSYLSIYTSSCVEPLGSLYILEQGYPCQEEAQFVATLVPKNLPPSASQSFLAGLSTSLNDNNVSERLDEHSETDGEVILKEKHLDLLRFELGDVSLFLDSLWRALKPTPSPLLPIHSSKLESSASEMSSSSDASNHFIPVHVSRPHTVPVIYTIPHHCTLAKFMEMLSDRYDLHRVLTDAFGEVLDETTAPTMNDLLRVYATFSSTGSYQHPLFNLATVPEPAHEVTYSLLPPSRVGTHPSRESSDVRFPRGMQEAHMIQRLATLHGVPNNKIILLQSGFQYCFNETKEYEVEVENSDVIRKVSVSYTHSWDTVLKKISLMLGIRHRRLALFLSDKVTRKPFSNYVCSTYEPIHRWTRLYVKIDAEIDLFVRNLNGTVKTFKVSPSLLTLEFKRIIEADWNIPADRQRLIFAGRLLNDILPLHIYNLSHESTMVLVYRR